MKIQMEIIAQIEAEENIAYGVNDSALSNDRAEAIDYYLGQPFGNEEEGRSQVISYDVQDTIESALPQLLKVFVAGDKVVQFCHIFFTHSDLLTALVYSSAGNGQLRNSSSW